MPAIDVEAELLGALEHALQRLARADRVGRAVGVDELAEEERHVVVPGHAARGVEVEPRQRVGEAVLPAGDAACCRSTGRPMSQPNTTSQKPKPPSGAARRRRGTCRMCRYLPRRMPSMSLHATLTLPAADLAHGGEGGVFLGGASSWRDCRATVVGVLPSAGQSPLGDAHLAQRVGHRVHRLLHLVAADRADAADAEGLDLRQLARVEDEAALLGAVVEALEVVGRVAPARGR